MQAGPFGGCWTSTAPAMGALPRETAPGCRPWRRFWRKFCDGLPGAERTDGGYVPGLPEGGTSFTELATFFIYKFPYRAANFNLGRFASQPSALPTELKRNIYKSGNNLSSQQGNPQVFSAHLGLTSVFGMGTGITLNVIVTRKLLYAKHTQKYIDEFRFCFSLSINFLF